MSVSPGLSAPTSLMAASQLCAPGKRRSRSLARTIAITSTGFLRTLRARRWCSSGSPSDVWWQKAREDAKRYTALYGWIPDSLPQEQQDLLFENLYEYVSMLLAEIIAARKPNVPIFVICSHGSMQATFHADGMATGQTDGYECTS